MTIHRIRLGIFSLAFFTLIALVAPRISFAQSTTQGAITGSVLDSSGAAIPGAAINIQNAATGFTMNLVSDSSGFFKAPLLEPGTYTVAVSAPNFAQYRAEQVTVFVSKVTTLSPHLAIASSTAEVIVTEQTPVMNLESPDFSGTLNQQAMQNVPINNRRWSSLAMTTPGVVSDASGYGLVSVRGISTLMNNVEIDGADDNQAFFSEERGRTRAAYSTSGNAVREFAVNTGVYSAQYGRAAGGVITSVTKSGTNQLHGQLYYFQRQSNWSAYNDYTMVTQLINGKNTSVHIKPEDLRKIYGFTAGGPLIKDKLFWIYTYDQHTHVFPVVGVPYSPQQFYTLPMALASLNAGESCNIATGQLTIGGAGAASINDVNACALAARQRITYNQAAYDWAAMLYGNSTISNGNYPGASPITDIGLNSAIGQVPRLGYQEINTPKLDWQINQRNRLSVLVHRLRWDSPGGVQTSAADNYAQDAQGNDFVKLDYGVTKLTSLITNNMSNEILYQYSRELDWEGQQPYTPYTLANFVGPNGNVPQVEAGYNYGFNAGSMYYAHRPAYPDERKWQISDIFYWNKGNHSLRFGADAVHNNDLMNNTYKSNGDFSYNWVGNLYNDLLNIRNGTPTYGCDKNGAQNYVPPSGTSSGSGAITGTYPCYYNFTQGFGNPVYAINTLDTGVFAQDNWKVSPRLTLEIGVRWDHETIPGPDPNLTTATGSFVPYAGMANAPSDNFDFGPRIGFAYNLSGSGETVLRGGYGLYYGRLTNGNLENVRLNTGSPNGQFSRVWYGNTSGAPAFLNVFAGGSAVTCTPGSSSCPSSYFLAPNLKLPEVQEFDLQLQQSMGRSTVFSLSYLGGLGRRLPNFLNVNLNPATVAVKTITVVGDDNGKGPLGPTNTTISVPVYTSYGNTARLGPNAANFSSVGEMISNVNSSYNAMVAEVLNQNLKFITFDVNYTWSHALDFAQNAYTQGAFESWYDPYSNPRINYGNSSFNVPNRFVGWALVNIPNWHTQNFARWITNGWSLNDSFQMQNGLPFTAGVNSKPSGAIGTSWNGSGGPSIIPQIGYNTYKYPRRIVNDVRVQKEFGFEKGRSLQLILNAFNVANHQNITGFQATYLYTMSSLNATYTGRGGTGASPKNFMVPNNSNSSAFLYTPRQVEISARINF